MLLKANLGYQGPYFVFIVSITIADLSIAIVILAKDILREYEILVPLERTVLFVNWVICGMSALSLRTASLDRLSYFMLSNTGVASSRI